MRKYRHCRNILAVSFLACAAAALAASCSNPESPDYNAFVSDGEYLFDIYMLAEWNGRIYPEKSDISAFSAVTYDSTAHTLTMLNDDKNVVFSFPVSNDTLTDNLLKASVNINALGLQNIALECTDSDKSGYFSCSSYYSGADAINKIWEKWADETDAQTTIIKTASGDSFGTSQTVSHVNDNLPTVAMLNLLGLNTDTYGNLSFNGNLKYLQNIIDNASYQYLLSNMSNVVQNLNSVKPYKLFDLRPSAPSGSTDNQAQAPKLAVIGAIAPSTVETVFPGRFGSLSISDSYCPVLQALEDAYNNGARAFFIAGHFDMDTLDIHELNGSLLSLKDGASSSAKYTCTNPSKAETCTRTHLQPCASKLHVSDEAQRIEIRKNIFNSIAGVMMASNDDVFQYVINSNDNDKSVIKYHNCYTETEETDNKLDKIFNVNKAFSDTCTDADEPLNPKEHYLWNIHLQTKGYSTAKASYRLKVNSKTSQDGTLTDQSFEVFPAALNASDNSLGNALNQSIKVLPIVSAPSKDYTASYTPNLNANINTLDITVESCQSLLELYHSKSTDSKTCEQSCAAMTNAVDRSQCDIYCSCNDIFTVSHSTADMDGSSGAQTNARCQKAILDFSKSASECLNRQSPTDSCRDAFIGQTIHESVKQSVIDQQQQLWACYYNFTNSNICKLDSTAENVFYERQFLTLKKLIPAQSKDDHRSKPTFTSNLIADAIYNYYNTDDSNEISSASEPRYDAVFFNAGSFRQSNEYTSITPTAISYWIPFGNRIKAIQVSVEELLTLMARGLAALKEKNNGAAPMLSGLIFAFNADTYQLISLFQVDGNMQPIRPLYFSGTKTCSPDTADEIKKIYSSLPIQSEIDGTSFINKFKYKPYTPDSTLYSDTQTYIKSGCILSDDGKSDNIQLKLILPDYLSTGGDGYSQIKEMSSTAISNENVDEAVIAYFRRISASNAEGDSAPDSTCSKAFSNTTTSSISDTIFNNSCKNRQFAVCNTKGDGSASKHNHSSTIDPVLCPGGTDIMDEACPEG